MTEGELIHQLVNAAFDELERQDYDDMIAESDSGFAWFSSITGELVGTPVWGDLVAAVVDRYRELT